MLTSDQRTSAEAERRMREATAATGKAANQHTSAEAERLLNEAMKAAGMGAFDLSADARYKAGELLLKLRAPVATAAETVTAADLEARRDQQRQAEAERDLALGLAKWSGIFETTDQTAQAAVRQHQAETRTEQAWRGMFCAR